MPDATAQRELTILRLTRFGLLVFWSLVIGYIVMASVVDHPLRASYRERQNLVALSPQGWAFFTRDPREPVEQVYHRKGDRWEIASFSNNSLRNLLGVRRAARAVSIELQAMLGTVPESRWIACEASWQTCLHQAPPPVRVENRSTLQSLCGELLVERRPPVPWAWSERIDHIHMPGQILRLEAVCTGGPDRAREVRS